eukprot:TRINITY_DN18198_c0_g1_i4.p1 TRINITY_DN18198_c0_g1~~TRINITY_DN18198_c0_g1_i4.p1  ORF type:complete len:215 (-),score=39.49 TRINITY_DN18198_c0_g1_i4:43-660(-)
MVYFGIRQPHLRFWIMLFRGHILMAAVTASVTAREGDVPDGLLNHVQKLGEQLACSACSYSTKSLRLLLGSKIKKTMTAKKKEAKLGEVLVDACKHNRFPEQLADITDETGVRRYDDGQEAMTRGGSFRNLNMSPTNLDDVVGVCTSLTQSFQTLIRQKILKTKDRPGSINWERMLCVKESRLCEKPIFHLDEDEDDEDEEGEEL